MFIKHKVFSVSPVFPAHTQTGTFEASWRTLYLAPVSVVATMLKHHRKCYNLQTLILISACVSDIAGFGSSSKYSSNKKRLEELESSVIEDEAFSLK